MPHRRGEIGRADAEKLLPRIESVTVLGGEGAGSGYSFDISQQQAAGRQRNDSLDVAQPESRACKAGQARRNFSCCRHPQRRKPQNGRGNDRQRDDAKRDRSSGQQSFAEYDQPDRDNPDGENDECVWPICPANSQVRSKKLCPPPGNAKKAWQLGHGDGQAGAGLEAHKNAVADQLDEHAQSQQPGEQAKRRHREGRKAGDLGVSLRIALCHRSHRSGNHERDCGSRADRQLTRRTEQGVAQTAEQIAVDTDLRRQACKSRIGERNRDRVGRQRYPGNDIAKAARKVGIQPTNGQVETTRAKLFVFGAPSNPRCGSPSNQSYFNSGCANRLS